MSDSDDSSECLPDFYLQISSECSKSSRKSVADLLNETQAMIQECENAAAVKQKEQELANFIIDSSSSELEEDTNENEVLKENVKIFNFHSSFVFFCLNDVTLESSGHLYDLTKFEHIFTSKRPSVLEHVLSSVLPIFTSNLAIETSVRQTKTFINFLLKTMCTHNQEETVQGCYNIIEQVIRTQSELKFSSEEIFTILFNYGVDIDSWMLLDVPDLKPTISKTRYNGIIDTWKDNLRTFLCILEEMVLNSCIADKDLSNVLKYLLFSYLDSDIQDEYNVERRFKQCIGIILEAIPEEIWQHAFSVIFSFIMSIEKISTLGSWNNICLLCKVMPTFSERGMILQKAVTISSLRKLSGVTDNIEPNLEAAEYSVLDLKDILENLGELESQLCRTAITLIDICISYLQMSLKTDYDSLLNSLKSCEERLKDITCPLSMENCEHMARIFSELQIVQPMQGLKYEFSDECDYENIDPASHILTPNFEELPSPEKPLHLPQFTESTGKRISTPTLTNTSIKSTITQNFGELNISTEITYTPKYADCPHHENDPKEMHSNVSCPIINSSVHNNVSIDLEDVTKNLNITHHVEKMDKTCMNTFCMPEIFLNETPVKTVLKKIDDNSQTYSTSACSQITPKSQDISHNVNKSFADNECVRFSDIKGDGDEAKNVLNETLVRPVSDKINNQTYSTSANTLNSREVIHHVNQKKIVNKSSAVQECVKSSEIKNNANESPVNAFYEPKRIKNETPVNTFCGHKQIVNETPVRVPSRNTTNNNQTYYTSASPCVTPKFQDIHNINNVNETSINTLCVPKKTDSKFLIFAEKPDGKISSHPVFKNEIVNNNPVCSISSYPSKSLNNSEVITIDDDSLNVRSHSALFKDIVNDNPVCSTSCHPYKAVNAHEINNNINKIYHNKVINKSFANHLANKSKVDTASANNISVSAKNFKTVSEVVIIDDDDPDVKSLSNPVFPEEIVDNKPVCSTTVLPNLAMTAQACVDGTNVRTGSVNITKSKEIIAIDDSDEGDDEIQILNHSVKRTKIRNVFSKRTKLDKPSHLTEKPMETSHKKSAFCLKKPTESSGIRSLFNFPNTASSNLLPRPPEVLPVSSDDDCQIISDDEIIYLN